MNWIKTKEALPPTKEYPPTDEEAYYRMSEYVFCYAPFSTGNGRTPSVKTMPCQASYIQCPGGDHWVCWSINDEEPSDEVFNVDEIKEWMPFPKPTTENK